MIEYPKDRAVVSLTGAVTTDSVTQVIGALRHARNQCFYDRIELAISSPGGDIHAYERLLECLDDLRTDDVRILAAASGRTASAAAFLLSSGDERRASANCRLTYHCSWTETPGKVTATTAGSAAAALDEIDRRIVFRLATRGAEAAVNRCGQRAPAKDFRPEDWAVVREILVVLSKRGADEFVDNEIALVRLREILDGCRPDIQALETVYRTLFMLDRPISPVLARELFLIDDIGSARGTARAPCGPSLQVPEWRAVWPDGRVELQYLRRHTLILGETGSGKTASGVMPLVKAILAPDSGVGCALLIDPKRELLSAARGLSANVRVIEAGTPRRPASALNLMASPQWALDADLKAGLFQSAARKILVRSATLASETPARIWAGLTSTDPRTAYWQQEGGTLASVALSLTLAIIQGRSRIFAGVDSPASILSAPKRLREALREFGEAAGILAPQRELRQALEDALGAAEAEQRETMERHTERRSTELKRTFAESAGSIRECLQKTLGSPLNEALEQTLDANMASCRQRLMEQIDPLRDMGEQAPSPGSDQAGWAILRRAVERTGIFALHAGFRDRFDALDRAISHATGTPDLKEAAERVLSCGFTALEDADVCPSPNVMALAQLALDLFLTPTELDDDESSASELGDEDLFGTPRKKTPEFMLPGSHLANALRSLFGPETEGVWRSVRRWETLARSGWAGQASGHYVSVLTIAQQAFREFSEEAPAWTLYFGVEPYWRNLAQSPDVDVIDFAKAVDAEEGRRVWVVQPNLVGERGILVAKAMKAAFFEAVLGNEDRAAGKRKPPVAYVADEFHRFVTSGDGHGEQSFLDTCRSFGAFCALASQSIASIEHALAGMDGNPAQNTAAVSILLNNVGTKIFFRTTDEGTIRRIRSLCPSAPGWPLVVDVRPPSTLAPGECYAALPDGRFERRQLAPCIPGETARTSDDEEDRGLETPEDGLPTCVSGIAPLRQSGIAG